MAQQPLKLKVIGIPHIPSITKINSRPDASTDGAVSYQIAVGTTDVTIIDVKADLNGKKDDSGRLYQWFRCQFPQGVAWVRDDLVEIWGDGSTVGYGVISTPTQGSKLIRQASTIPQGAETQSPSTESEVSPAPDPAPSTESEVSSTPDPAPSTESEVSSAPVAPLGPGMALSMLTKAKLRSGPGTGHTHIGDIPKGQSATVLDSAMGDDGKALHWVKVDFNGTQGWTREDLVRLSGNFPAFGFSAPDKYPNPTPVDTQFARGWDPDNTIWNTGNHVGWDHSGPQGLPLLAGPQGGVVFAKELCAKCGPQGLSTRDRNIPLYNPSVYSDPGWNYGYGHYVIVGYENSKLPASTKAYLDSEGRAGQHIFVMYAHCRDLMVEAGTTVEPNQQIGTIGNSGNSHGAHLHLEVRISPTMTPGRWATIKDGLRSPGILFLR